MSWDTNLTGTYLEIAESTSARIRVMAGPGTGKTFAMKRRIARLLEAESVHPNRILAVTFTRTAAADLKRELHDMDIPGCDSIRAGTLHAFCFHLLRKNEVFEFLERVPRGLISFNKSKIYRFEIEPLIQDISALAHFGTKREILHFEFGRSKRTGHDFSTSSPVGLSIRLTKHSTYISPIGCDFTTGC
jgi:DNA helicase-2/ATP-dependent DNA helicase PcrA